MVMSMLVTIRGSGIKEWLLVDILCFYQQVSSSISTQNYLLKYLSVITKKGKEIALLVA